MSPLCGPVIAEKFSDLTALLLRHQQLWRGKPFIENHMPWETEFPQLAEWLRAQSLEHAEHFQLIPEQIMAPAPFRQWADELMPLTGVGRFPVELERELPPRMNTGVPGRKWQQISQFAQALPQDWFGSDNRWLDWCSGKGYLGRHLAWPDACLCCVEHDLMLVQAGEALSERWAVRAAHAHCDALSPAADEHLAATTTWIALHACGDLHTRLLRKTAEHGVRQLAVAPCCYNRIAADAYQPLSAAGQRAGLRLSKDELGIPLQATVTAAAGEVRQRNRMMAWRLGFDRLQREWRGADTYLPVPSAANRWAQDSFADWCLAVAQQKAVKPQPVADWAMAEQAGWDRMAQVRNLELVQGLFRRPLELWLLLDMALYLQEQGFAVQLGEFCPQQLTPRNLLLVATR